MYDASILILNTCKCIFFGCQSPSSQTVGSLLRTPWPAKPATKMIYLETYFLKNPQCKFADSRTIHFGDYCQIVLNVKQYFAQIKNHFVYKLISFYILCKKRVVVQNKLYLQLKIFWNQHEHYNYLQLTKITLNRKLL